MTRHGSEKQAKLFMNGRSQAVRLPASCRFEGDSVYVRRDPNTGDVILSKRPSDWSDFFVLLGRNPAPPDFMIDRDLELPQERTILVGPD
jgi:antitoxin VapB